MKELIIKDNLLIEELEKLDIYYSKNLDELMKYDNKIIIKLIDNIDSTLGYSLLKIDLENFFCDELIGIQYLFNEEKIEEYLKYYELIRYYSFEDYGLSYTLGDYYYHKKDSKKALFFYESIFKSGYNLCNENYYYSLERFLKINEGNAIDKLIELINNSPVDNGYSLDYVNTCLLLIIRLGIDDKRYIEYINKSIEIAYKVIDKLQIGDDSDEERNLCELLSLKYEYLVINREYKLAYETHKKLTKEIATSNCTRYYHARNKYYYLMLKSMSEQYNELCFFDEINNSRLEILEDIDDINKLIGQIITLKKDNESTYKFIIKHVYKNYNITIAPILPILGEGEVIFTDLIIINNKTYLEVK